MVRKGANHPCVVWGGCFLWLTSMFAITWSILLFICLSNMLIRTGMDLVNAFVLLSGLVMLPTNLHMMYSISQNKTIRHNSKVTCCPLWLCIIWIIIINLIGASLCLHRLRCGKSLTESQISTSMQYYRSYPNHKDFMDTLQWTLKCCGLNSHKDWFTRNWYDKILDYEWEPPSFRKRSIKSKKTLKKPVTDSVPLSCCKTGSCISNYLTELGTYSINTIGCKQPMHKIVMISMIGHFSVFMLIVLIEIIILCCIIKNKDDAECHPSCRQGEEYNVKHIMDIKENFEASSDSYVAQPEDSDSSRQLDDEN